MEKLSSNRAQRFLKNQGFQRASFIHSFINSLIRMSWAQFISNLSEEDELQSRKLITRPLVNTGADTALSPGTAKTNRDNIRSSWQTYGWGWWGCTQKKWSSPLLLGPNRRRKERTVQWWGVRAQKKWGLSSYWVESAFGRKGEGEKLSSLSLKERSG